MVWLLVVQVADFCCYLKRGGNIKDSIYYNGNSMLTHNAFISMIIGPRGYGKSFWAKEWALRDFIKNKKQFIYLRRYESDLNKISTFFDDTIAEEHFTDYELRVSRTREFLVNDEVAGWALPLSKAQSYKSTPFPNVNKIIFDEFIIEKGSIHYIQGGNEPEIFLGFCETVFRSRDDVRAVLLANSVTMNNPYFNYWNIYFQDGKKMTKRNDGLILAELVDGEEFKTKKKETKLARAIKGTRLSDYTIENKFYLDSDTFIEKKKGTATYYITLIYKGKHYGVYQDYKEGLMIVSEDIDPFCTSIFSLTTDDHRPNALFLASCSRFPAIKRFKDMFNAGVMRFESIRIKQAVFEMINLLG